ncbi:MAG: helix-turn-helix transcriptional regulator [Pseudomonadota bacterium]
MAKEFPYKEIGLRLEVVMRASNMNQAEFARALSAKPNTVSNWITGAQRLSLNGALLIRDRFGVPLDWMYCGGMTDRLPANVLNTLSGTPRNKNSQ